MKKSFGSVLICCLVGLLINLSMSYLVIFVSLPPIIVNNIVGTTFVGAFAGSICGAIVAVLSTLILMYYRLGVSPMMMFAIVALFDGLISGIKFSENSFKRVFLRSLVMALVIPLIGNFVSNMYFEQSMDVFSLPVLANIWVDYISYINYTFWMIFCGYGFSCFVGELMSNKLKKMVRNRNMNDYERNYEEDYRTDNYRI